MKNTHNKFRERFLGSTECQWQIRKCKDSLPKV